MFDLLIKNAAVITVDPAHHIYQPGYVAVQGDRIAAVGPMEELPADAAAERVIDADGLCVMPGLVDGHAHAGHTLTKTLGEGNDNQTSEAWWGQMAEDIYYHYTDEFFWYAEGALAAAERIKFGITTGVSMLGSTPRPDDPALLQAHFDGSLKTGIRQISGIGSCDGPWPKHPWVWNGDTCKETELTPEQMVANTEKAVKELNGKHPRQICIPTPGGMGFNPKAETREFAIWKNQNMARIAKEFGTPLHTHLYGGGIEFVYDTTPEALGPTTSLTHCTGLTERDIQILAETGTCLFHGPTTRANIKKRCPVYEVLRAGGNVAIVTDATSPDRSYDIWRDMKIFQVIHRAHENDTRLAPVGKVLEMCTMVPARALGLDKEIGSLEKGKKADIIIINTKQPHLAPFGIMPLHRVVYHAQGNDVDTVIVDGQIMMEGRKLLCCDEDRILEDAGKAFDTMRARIGEEKFAAFMAYDTEAVYSLTNHTMPSPYMK